MNATEVIAVDGLPISVNHAYVQVTRRRTRDTPKGAAGTSYKGKALTAEAKAWQELVQWCVLEQRVKPHQDWTDKPIFFSMTLYVKDRSADVDGGVKFTLDAVAKALRFNDRMVDKQSSERCFGVRNGEHVAIYVAERI